jgi:hypothetical protein
MASSLLGRIGICQCLIEERFDEGAPLQAPTKEWPGALLINAKLHTVKIERWYMGKEGKLTDRMAELQAMADTDDEGLKEALQDTVDAILGEFEMKADNIVMLRRNIESDIDAINKEVERLNELKRVKKNSISQACRRTCRPTWCARTVFLLAGQHDNRLLPPRAVRSSS